MSASPAREARREATRAAVKSGDIAPVKRNLNPSEVLELQELNRIAQAHIFVANQMKANTYRLPRRRKLFGFLFGNKSELVDEAMAVARLMDDVKRQWVAQRLTLCGYLPNTICDINMATGEITLTPPKPAEPLKPDAS